MTQKPILFTSALIDVIDLSPNTKHFTFEVPKDFTFLAGQFVMVSLIGDEGKPIKRAFSIASSPSSFTGKIELCVKILHDGRLSTRLAKLKLGDTVSMQGPYGKFFLEESSNEKLFLAAGTGIAPLRSMIHNLVENGCTDKITLMFGFHCPKDHLYKKETEELLGKYPNLNLVPICSTPDENCGDKIGHIQDHLDIFTDGSSIDVYICGPPKMVSTTIPILLKLNFKRIYREAWG